MRDTKHAGAQKLDGAGVVRRARSSTTRADKFKKVEFGEIDKEAADPTRKPAYTKSADNGWIGMIEHYFVAAWLPPTTGKTAAPVLHDASSTTASTRRACVVPAARSRRAPPAKSSVPLYVGPQDQDVLAKLAPGLDLVVDYGIFTIIAAPLFWLLKWLHGLIGNWGWAIIVLTIIIKGAFYPLNTRARARWRR